MRDLVFGRAWMEEFWEKGSRNGLKIGSKTHRYRLGLKMGPSALYRVLSHTATLDWDF